MQRPRASQRGHFYFELIEKGRGDRIVGKIDAVMWRTDHLRVRRTLAGSGQEIANGQQIRCWGSVDFYGPAGRLQLIVRDVDAYFTLGLLERRRRQTLAALTRAGLLDRNRRLPLSAVPLGIGLVTSRDSAAYHDFLTGLAESGYGFRVVFAHAAMQGTEAEREVSAALALLSDIAAVGPDGLDAIVLIRGGGSRSDLAAFDSRRIAEAVASSPLPVLTGLGHEIDRSIVDQVSHAAFNTPTKAAEFLIEQVELAERGLMACEAALAQVAADRLRRAKEDLQRCERLAQVAALRLQGAAYAVRETARAVSRLGRQRLREALRTTDGLQRRLASAPARLLERHRDRPQLLARRLAGAASGRLREAEARLTGVERLCHELSPVRVLERGYSITRDEADNIVREPRQVAAGERIVTTLATGFVASRVEEP